MSFLARVLFKKEDVSNSRVKYQAFLPREGGVSTILEDGLTDNAIGETMLCVEGKRNAPLITAGKGLKELFGRARVENEFIHSTGLGTTILDKIEGDCFQQGHHCNIDNWPFDSNAQTQLAQQLAAEATKDIIPYS